MTPLYPPGKTWYVLYVKPRTEKKVDGILADRRVFHYLPVYVKITKVQRRKVRRELPLFPGYVFTRLTADERRRMLETNLIVRTILVHKPRQLIHELRQIAHASRRTADLRPVTMFKEGDLVRVTTGPFMGLEGYVKRNGEKSTIVLNLEMLGQAVEVAIPNADCQLQPK